MTAIRPPGLEEFYRGKRVFVTGHSGFKGGWLTAWLQEMGAEVIGFSLPLAHGEPDVRDWAGVSSDAVLLSGDVNDFQGLSTALSTHSPEIVLHLAAQTLVRRSYREPIWTLSTNVLGTAHVLEAVRQCPSVRSVVVVTSDKCYENQEWPWGYRETDPLGGYDPYSASKGCAEIVTHAYRRSYFSPAGDGRAAIASARAGNVIGGGDWCEDRLVPDIFRALLRGAPIVLRNPGSVRPWQHVLEPIHGYLHLARELWERPDAAAGAWNFGPSADDTLTVQEVTERMVRLWGAGEIHVEQDPAAPHEAGLLTLDCAKARATLGWRPVLTNREALDLTVEWYRSFGVDRSSIGALTRRQIREYGQVIAGDAAGIGTATPAVQHLDAAGEGSSRARANAVRAVATPHVYERTR